MLTTATIDEFPGLNLTQDGIGAGARIATNVDLDLPGRVRTRPGRSYLSAAINDSATFASAPYRIVSTNLGTIATNGATLGNYFVTLTTAAPTPYTDVGVDVAEAGTATTERVYVIDNTGIRLWDGTTLAAAVANTPRGGFLANWATQGRLVAAYSKIGGSPSSHRVHFSNPNAPQTWTYASGPPETGDFVDLEPGNGEGIVGVVAAGDYVVVFKETRAYVFYGLDVDVTGNAIFRYRTIELGDRMGSTGLPGRIATDGRNVYFVATAGVYAMPAAGGTPVLISGELSAFFRDEVSAVYDNFALWEAYGFVTVTADKLFIGNRNAPYTLVRDRTSGTWSVYDIASSAIAPNYGGAGPETLRTALIADAGNRRLTRLDTSVATDLGGALSWQYRTGWFDLGYASQEKTVRYTDVTGIGTVTLKRLRDFAATDSQSAAITMDADPGSTERHTKSWAGTLMAMDFSGTGAATITRVTHHVRNVRPAGMKTS